MKIDWKDTMQHSDNILYKGLNELQASKVYSEIPKGFNRPGNYLISANGNPIYIGESNNIANRVTTHLKKLAITDNYLNQAITFQFMNTDLGRKEIEEFGCFHLKELNNKFHRKREFAHFNKSNEIEWDYLQDNYLNNLSEGMDDFIEIPYSPWHSIGVPKLPGVYSILHDQQIIYIGQGISLQNRIKMHERTTRFSAFRRSVATKLLNFKLKTKQELGYLESKDFKRSFLTPEEDNIVDKFINDCHVSFMPVGLGRLELEIKLIDKFKPTLNKRGL